LALALQSGWLMEIVTTPLGRVVIGCAIEVHKAIGPGVLESMYEEASAHEFGLRGLAFKRQVCLPVTYKGVNLGTGYRVDFVVEGELVVELKTVERLLPVHDAQVLTYLRVLNLPQGLLINFNVPLLKRGIRSILNSRATNREEVEE
jgi:GxxExxY protein